jgi:DNA-binding beta-propeller fold protein YncE
LLIRVISFLLLGSCLFAQTYKLGGTISIGGPGGWDYLTADSANRRLYVSHGSEVVVVDLDTDKVTGHITGLNRIHGIVVADDLGVGFISDGGANQVVMFGLKDLAIQKRIKAGTNPDGIVYDPSSHRVFAFNGRSNDATAIDAKTGSVAGTVKLDGKPEFPAADGRGSVYANIEDKSEITRIDAQALTVQGTWPLAPCEEPSGLAIDPESRRLFAVCDNHQMAVVDADSGKVVATPPIGDGPDATAFDPGLKLVFSSNGRGSLTVVKESDPNSFSVVQTLQTALGARTMALDTKTHKVYLATADLGPTPAATASNPHPRPTIKPDTFRLIIATP